MKLTIVIVSVLAIFVMIFAGHRRGPGRITMAGHIMVMVVMVIMWRWLGLWQAQLSEGSLPARSWEAHSPRTGLCPLLLHLLQGSTIITRRHGAYVYPY